MTRLPQKIRVPRAADGLPLGRFLEDFLGLSWEPGTVQVLLEQRLARDPAAPVAAGQLLQLRAAPPAPAPIPILLETPELLVVHKPAGLAVQGAPGCLLELLEPSLGPLKTVHRLDLPVSGVMVLGRGPGGAMLDRAFREGRIAKVYLAAVERPFEADLLTGGPRLLDWPLQWQAASRRALVLPQGDPARTLLLPLSPHLALCRLVTGRTHQIRAHLARLGHPLLGDLLYQSQDPGAGQERPRRIGLHSLLLELALPGGTQAFFVPPPPDFPACPDPLPSDLEATAQALARASLSF